MALKKITINNMARNKEELEERAINIIDRLLEKGAITGSEAVTLIHAIINKEKEDESIYTLGTYTYPGTNWINTEQDKNEYHPKKPGEIYCHGNGTGDYYGYNTTVTC